jgi:hypothetical protein
MKDQGKSKKQLINESAELRQQVDELTTTKKGREGAWERIQHLNAVLRSIRNVNQLIVKEKDRDRLLEGICENLSEALGYYNAWIVLLDDAKRLVTVAEAGLGEGFSHLLNRLNRGKLPACGRKALMQSNIVITQDPFSTCTDCPLAEKYEGRGGYDRSIGVQGKSIRVVGCIHSQRFCLK